MTRTPGPRSRRWIAIGAMVGVLLIPTAVVAAGGAFTDDDTSVFEANIEWMVAAGVTQGCNPPDNTLFCPEDGVTRGQMAAFMQRFAKYLGAEDGSPAEADNASTLDGLEANQLNGVRSTGGNTSIPIDGVDFDTDFDDLGTVTVTAPTDGAFVIMWGAWFDCTAATIDEIRLYIDGTESELFIVEECTASTFGRSISAHHVEAAAEGVTYEFQMRGHDWDEDAESWVNDPRLTVMFMPFGIDSEAPVLDRMLQNDQRATPSDGTPGS